jgi:predicted nucleotidyltransferase
MAYSVDGQGRRPTLYYMEPATHLGESIRTRRLEAGMTAARLAAAAGVTENAIRKLESGDSAEPRFSTGVRLARALGISPLILIPDIDRAAEPPSLPRVIRLIRNHRSQLEDEGVAHLDVFGSVARGDAHADSDVDLIVTPRSGVAFTLFELGGVGNILEEALGRRVDIVTRRGVEKSTRLQGALEDAIRAF